LVTGIVVGVEDGGTIGEAVAVAVIVGVRVLVIAA